MGLYLHCLHIFPHTISHFPSELCVVQVQVQQFVLVCAWNIVHMYIFYTLYTNVTISMFCTFSLHVLCVCVLFWAPALLLIPAFAWEILEHVSIVHPRRHTGTGHPCWVLQFFFIYNQNIMLVRTCTMANTDSQYTFNSSIHYP